MANYKTTIDPQDIVDTTIGQYTVLGYLGKENGKHIYKCKCSCGTENKQMRNNLEHSRSFKINMMCVRCVKRDRHKRSWNKFETKSVDMKRDYGSEEQNYSE